MTDFFQELFEYNNNSNQKLTATLNGNAERISEKTLSLFSHLLNSHHIWNMRILNLDTLYKVWQIQNISDFDAINKQNLVHSLSILNNQDLNEIVSYTNTKGQTFRSTIKDIFFHIINHSTYHRGQLAMEMRNSGLEPAVTDYIVYKR